MIAALFFYMPFFKSLALSFFNVSASGAISSFAWLDNYRSLFTSQDFLKSITTTALFTILFVPLNIVLIASAASLTRRKTRLSFIPETIFFIPMAFSLSAVALTFKEIFRGSVSIAGRIFHTDIPWLSSPSGAMFALVLLGVFLDFGLDYILLLSSFRSIDRSIIESAEIDGCTSTQSLFHIELPIVRPMLMILIFLSIKDAILISAPVMILTEGGPFGATETVMYYYYTEAFRSSNRAIETTLSTIMVLFSALVIAAASRWRRR